MNLTPIVLNDSIWRTGKGLCICTDCDMSGFYELVIVSDQECCVCIISPTFCMYTLFETYLLWRLEF